MLEADKNGITEEVTETLKENVSKLAGSNKLLDIELVAIANHNIGLFHMSAFDAAYQEAPANPPVEHLDEAEKHLGASFESKYIAPDARAESSSYLAHGSAIREPFPSF
ncbi:MAG: hypothetical protein GY804_06150 [Alphaproteobacteria bacterium]|nr:hypothetical protein [Alphaproteobacteria bacterium]